LGFFAGYGLNLRNMCGAGCGFSVLKKLDPRPAPRKKKKGKKKKKKKEEEENLNLISPSILLISLFFFPSLRGTHCTT
jgi:hypothetical protein